MTICELTISNGTFTDSDGLKVKVEPLGRPQIISGRIGNVDADLAEQGTYEILARSVAAESNIEVPQKAGYVLGQTQTYPGLNLKSVSFQLYEIK